MTKAAWFPCSRAALTDALGSGRHTPLLGKHLLLVNFRAPTRPLLSIKTNRFVRSASYFSDSPRNLTVLWASLACPISSFVFYYLW
jgi:hypothetical protein